MSTFRVRGIYSTALTKLLLDHNYEMVQPSTTLRDRFSIQELNKSPELDISDRGDRQGVQALGNPDSIHAFKSILQANLHDAIIREWPATANGIYRGRIQSEETDSFLIDIGSAKGRIPKGQITNSVAKPVVVQVDSRRVGAKRPELTTKIKMPGEYAILIPEREIKISRKIRDPEIRSRLHQLGREIAPHRLGIIWRTAARDQPTDRLRTEVAHLAEQREAVLEGDAEAAAPTELWEGRHFLDVEFPALSKKRLDDIRNFVTETIEDHHYYKACGGDLAAAVDMAERLLKKGQPSEEVENLFRQTIISSLPTVGSKIEIRHVKLDGRILNLGEGTVEDFDQDRRLLSFSRTIKGEGTYDGLGTRREPGDRAETEASVGGWHYNTQYYSKEGRYKGTYINLNTPIEIYPYGIRYVDLEVDICVWPSGRVGKVDEKKLERAAEEGMITQKLVDTVERKVRDLMRTAA
ncbi:DUF402 domain-containing protein [Candidatus Bathyarchaeota archaeon]|nr:DUF402 domain-containing protein [Candidatus Bathyarchaeota archaeon]NIU81469.1 DUF402 domain-containing protein [Candidatus Bathyarchaeota archaeon]NIV68115.1 DUF402 domain-containing protein [Candidatus Bathyarchaeota archaeon]NIW16025.1 DUF402 domain-containing protein [Candidatus Bathyarchaeota archaeon]NIW34626.1 DUF402 domain-containing protein [Candidatus Bathyarchaeota archaeon]